jgi:hypothetical protein
LSQFFWKKTKKINYESDISTPVALRFRCATPVAKRIQGDVNRFTDQINYFDYQIHKCIFAFGGLGFWSSREVVRSSPAHQGGVAQGCETTERFF